MKLILRGQGKQESIHAHGTASYSITMTRAGEHVMYASLQIEVTKAEYDAFQVDRHYEITMVPSNV